MPELPEVETVRRELEERLVGRTIVGGAVPAPKLLKEPVRDQETFLSAVRGQRIQSVRRRGKYLIFGLGNGYAVVSHLKMRGHMRVFGPDESRPDKYLCVALDLDDDARFGFYDIWGWGEMRILPDTDEAIQAQVPALGKMGVEPLTGEFTADALRKAATKHPKTPIKACLLDQSVLAGVGNIYSDEFSFRANIRPDRRVADLTDAQWPCLRDQIQAVLSEAVRLHGTVSDNFFDTNGKPGRYVPRVYDRAGTPCLCCQTQLVRTKVAGRGTVYCPSCQI